MKRLSRVLCVLLVLFTVFSATNIAQAVDAIQHETSEETRLEKQQKLDSEYIDGVEGMPLTESQKETVEEINKQHSAEPNNNLPRGRNTPSPAKNLAGTEDESKRTINEKHYQLEDGNYEAIGYPTEVFYENEDGELEYIVNDLTVDQESGTLKNKANTYEVSFPLKSKAGENIIEYSLGKYRLGWKIVAAETKVEEVSLDESPEINRFDGREIAVKDTSDMKSKKHIKVEKLSENHEISEAKEVRIKGKNLLTSDVVEQIETEDLKRSLLAGNMSEVRYTNILQGVDVQYELNGQKLQENIILKTIHAPRAYIQSMETENLVLEYQKDTKEIFCNDIETGETILVIPPPFMFDSAEEWTDGIEITLNKTENGYDLIYTLTDHEWLEKAKYPVTVDPIITKNWNAHAGGSRDQHIRRGSPNAYYNAADNRNLSVGWIDNKSSDEIFSLVYIPISGVPSSAHVTSATFYATMDRPSASVSSTVGIHQIRGGWDTKVTWNRCPSITQAVSKATVTKTPNVRYNWDITPIAREWVSGASANHGVALRTQGTTHLNGHGFKHFASSRKNVPSQTPSLTIRYSPTLAPHFSVQASNLNNGWTNNRKITINWDWTIPYSG